MANTTGSCSYQIHRIIDPKTLKTVESGLPGTRELVLRM